MRAQESVVTCSGSAGATRLLWIDDEVRSDHALLHVLAASGVSVDLAASGAEGLAKALSKKYDAILVDLKLPDIFGLTVVRRLAGIQSARILVASGCYLEPEIEAEALRLGAARFLRKPFLEPEDLLDSLTNAGRQPGPPSPPASSMRKHGNDAASECIDALCSRLAECASRREQLTITLGMLLDSRMPLPLVSGCAAALRLLVMAPSGLSQVPVTVDRTIRDAAAHPLPTHSKLLEALAEIDRTGAKQKESSLAKRVGLSRTYFGRLLFAQTGRRYHDWMRLAVMRAVVRPVLQNSDQASQIAFRAGYDTLSHLDHDCVSTFGVPPRRLRQLYLECKSVRSHTRALD